MPQHNDDRFTLFDQLIQFFVSDALPACVAVDHSDVSGDPAGHPVQHGFAVCDLLAEVHTGFLLLTGPCLSALHILRNLFVGPDSGVEFEKAS